jgi:hypothetical protein
LLIFSEKIGAFLKLQCYDHFFCKITFCLNKKIQPYVGSRETTTGSFQSFFLTSLLLGHCGCTKRTFFHRNIVQCHGDRIERILAFLKIIEVPRTNFRLLLSTEKDTFYAI